MNFKKVSTTDGKLQDHILQEHIQKLPPEIKLATEIAYFEERLANNKADYAQTTVRCKGKAEKLDAFIKTELQLASISLYEEKNDLGIAHINHCIHATESVPKAGGVIDMPHVPHH